MAAEKKAVDLGLLEEDDEFEFSINYYEILKN